MDGVFVLLLSLRQTGTGQTHDFAWTSFLANSTGNTHAFLDEMSLRRRTQQQSARKTSPTLVKFMLDLIVPADLSTLTIWLRDSR